MCIGIGQGIGQYAAHLYIISSKSPVGQITVTVCCLPGRQGGCSGHCVTGRIAILCYVAL